MIRLWNRIRDWAILGGLIFMSLIFLLSANEPMLRGLRARALEATGSVESNFAWVSDYVSALKENRALRLENQELGSQVALSRDAIARSRVLEQLLGLRDSLEYDVMPAQIISKDITRERNTILLNVGSNDGIKEDMAVIDPRGILGFIDLVGSDYSQAITYLNTAFETPAVIQETGSDGLLGWDGKSHSRLLLEHVERFQRVSPGQHVVTSGYSGIFQPGYPIGVIDSVFVLPGMTTWQIYVRPSARIDNAAHVFVVRDIPDPARSDFRAR
jgi:rod shape-determining protein MreC